MSTPDKMPIKPCSRWLKALLLAIIALQCAGLLAEEIKTVPYEPNVVVLSGTIVQEGYGADSSPIDRNKMAWILRLDRPITIPAKEGDELNIEEKEVTEIHLNVNHAKHPVAKDEFGRVRFTATGTLYHGHNSHHLRSIVMMVSGLKQTPAVRARKITPQ